MSVLRTWKETVSTEDVGHWLTRCEDHASFTAIELPGKGVQDDIVTLILSLAMRCENLRTLKLGQNEITDQCAINMGTMLSLVPCLTHLDLSRNKIGWQGAEAVACSFLSMATKLKEAGELVLDFSHNMIEEKGALAIAKHLNPHRATVLRLRGVGCTGQALKEILASKQALRELDVAMNPIGVTGFEAASRALIGGACWHTLCLSHLEGSDSDKLGKRLAKPLAECVGQSPELKHFLCSGNNLGDSGSAQVVEAFCKSSEVLALTHLRLGESGCGLHAAKALKRALHHKGPAMSSHADGLCMLDLEGNKLDCDCAKVLAEGLEHSVSLQELWLARNHIKDKGAVALASALRKQRQHGNVSPGDDRPGCVVELDLTKNPIGDEGAKALARAASEAAEDPACRDFTSPWGLERLHLGETRIGTGGCYELCAAVSSRAALADSCIASLQDKHVLKRLQSGSVRRPKGLDVLGLAMMNDDDAADLRECAHARMQRYWPDVMTSCQEVVVTAADAEPESVRSTEKPVSGMSSTCTSSNSPSGKALTNNLEIIEDYFYTPAEDDSRVALVQAARDAGVPESTRNTPVKNQSSRERTSASVTPPSRLFPASSPGGSAFGRSRSAIPSAGKAEVQREEMERKNLEVEKRFREKAIAGDVDVALQQSQDTECKQVEPSVEPSECEPEMEPSTESIAVESFTERKAPQEAVPPKAPPGKGKAPPAPTAGKGKGKGAPPPLPTGEGSAAAGKAKGKGKGSKGRGAPPPPKAKSQAAAKSTMSTKSTTESSDKADSQVAEVADSQCPFNRKLHWVQPTYEEPEGETIFTDLADSYDFDTTALEKMFGFDAEVPKPTRRFSVGGVKPSGIVVLDANRAQNIAIVMQKVQLPAAEICECLQDLDFSDKRLSIDNVELLMTAMPTPEECKKLLEHKDAIHALRDIEQKVMPFCFLKRIIPRLKLLKLALSHHATYTGLLDRCNVLSKAAEEAMQKRSPLRGVLSIVLKVGNFINHGAKELRAAGAARAFAIESLQSYVSFKVGSVSVMHFICLSISNSDPSFLQKLKKSMLHIPDAAKEKSLMLKAAVEAFGQELTFARHALEVDGKEASIDVKERMETLAEQMQEENEEMLLELDRALKLGVGVQKYFNVASEKNGQALKLPPCEQFFEHLANFLGAFESAWVEVDKSVDIRRKLGHGGEKTKMDAPKHWRDRPRRVTLAAIERHGSDEEKVEKKALRRRQTTFEPPSSQEQAPATLLREQEEAAEPRRNRAFTEPVQEPAPAAGTHSLRAAVLEAVPATPERIPMSSNRTSEAGSDVGLMIDVDELIENIFAGTSLADDNKSASSTPDSSREVDSPFCAPQSEASAATPMTPADSRLGRAHSRTSSRGGSRSGSRPARLQSPSGSRAAFQHAEVAPEALFNQEAKAEDSAVTCRGMDTNEPERSGTESSPDGIRDLQSSGGLTIEALTEPTVERHNSFLSSLTDVSDVHKREGINSPRLQLRRALECGEQPKLSWGAEVRASSCHSSCSAGADHDFQRTISPRDALKRTAMQQVGSQEPAVGGKAEAGLNAERKAEPADVPEPAAGIDASATSSSTNGAVDTSLPAQGVYFLHQQQLGAMEQACDKPDGIGDAALGVCGNEQPGLALEQPESTELPEVAAGIQGSAPAAIGGHFGVIDENDEEF